MDSSLAKKTKVFWTVILLSLLAFCTQPPNSTPIPDSSRQLILVITESVQATKGNLYRFERKSHQDDWKVVGEKIAVVIGRNGLGLGNGLQPMPESAEFPIKKEGDGRSPAGVFRLSSVFGYAPAADMTDLKMPYLHITEKIECVDDTNSQYYNSIVSTEKIEAENIDWRSSEKMRAAGVYYELGVIIDVNTNPLKKGAGSCIFLHNWSNPDETMAGCTAMAPSNMKEIICWLESARSPVLVQLTEQLYTELTEPWGLPELSSTEN